MKMYPQAIQGVDEFVTSSETSLHNFAGLFWCESTTGDDFPWEDVLLWITFTFIHLADSFILSDLQLRKTISDTL